jgi:NAD(P)-dependent dehydrogenase (short-subunit alcohol dehydrogenase family)
VVTGSASGSGRATRERLEAGGARVIGVDRSDCEITADLSDPDGRRSIVERVAELTGGSLDAVIACAGLGGTGGEVVRVNYFGAVSIVVGLQPLLASSPAPRAVVVASIGITATVYDALVDACLEGDEAGAVAIADLNPEVPVYTSTKRALARWVRRAAPQPAWAGQGIPLNAVGPGLIQTPMTSAFLADPEMRQILRTSMPQPLVWPGQPEHVAPALEWLTSVDNAMITGQCLFVDGGLDALRRGDNIW